MKNYSVLDNIYGMYHEHVPMEDIVEYIQFTIGVGWFNDYAFDVMISDPKCPISEADKVYLRMAL